MVMHRTRNPANRLIPARRFKSCTLLNLIFDASRLVGCHYGITLTDFFIQINQLLLKSFLLRLFIITIVTWLIVCEWVTIQPFTNLGRQLFSTFERAINLVLGDAINVDTGSNDTAAR